MNRKLVLIGITVIACNDSQARNAVDTAGTGQQAIGGSNDALSGTAQEIRLEQVGDRFRSPVHLASPPGDSRLFIVEQARSEEHTSELQSPCNLVCRLLLEKK